MRENEQSATASQLQEEIGQTVPFHSASQEALVGIARTADVLRRRLEQTLAPFDITLQQYNVLRILRGGRGKPLPTLEIGERMIERTPGITRLIDRLEQKDLVRRERCAEDRRIVFCHITTEGLALLERAERPVTAVDEMLAEVLSLAELNDLIDALDRIRLHVEQA